MKQKIVDMINQSCTHYLVERSKDPDSIDFESLLENLSERFEKIKNEIADITAIENISVDEVVDIEDEKVLYFVLDCSAIVDPSCTVNFRSFEIHSTNVFEASLKSFRIGLNILASFMYVRSLDLKLIRMDNAKQPGEVIEYFGVDEYSILYEIYRIHLESNVEITPTVKVAEMLNGKWVLVDKEFIYFDDVGLKCPYEKE